MVNVTKQTENNVAADGAQKELQISKIGCGIPK